MTTLSSIAQRVLNLAGCLDLLERAGQALPFSEGELRRVESADLHVAALLADTRRAVAAGERVLLVHGDEAVLPQGCVAFDATANQTGLAVMRELALTRLALPLERSLAFSVDRFGLELAQTALIYGADALYGHLASTSLPLASRFSTDKRREIEGLIERAGRTPEWLFPPASTAAQASEGARAL